MARIRPRSLVVTMHAIERYCERILRQPVPGDIAGVRSQLVDAVHHAVVASDRCWRQLIPDRNAYPQPQVYLWERRQQMLLVLTSDRPGHFKVLTVLGGKQYSVAQNVSTAELRRIRAEKFQANPVWKQAARVWKSVSR